MRAIVFAMLGLCACGGGAGNSDLGGGDPAAGDLSGAVSDLGAGGADLAGADLAGDCPAASGALHYAITGGLAKSTLWRLGENGWDSQIGHVVFQGTKTPMTLDGISGSTTALIASAGRFIGTLDTTPNADGNVEFHQIDSVSGGTYDFSAVSPNAGSEYIAGGGGAVYCVSPSEIVQVGGVNLGAYSNITAITGTCSFMVAGAFQVDLMAESNGIGSAAFRITRTTGAGEAVVQAKTADTSEQLYGLSSGHSVSDSGSIFTVPIGTSMPVVKLRDTQGCIGPGNPFNGDKVGGLRGVVW